MTNATALTKLKVAVACHNLWKLFTWVIIKDGHIMQQSRLEELITKPEEDYVSKCVSSMSALGFISAAD